MVERPYVSPSSDNEPVDGPAESSPAAEETVDASGGGGAAPPEASKAKGPNTGDKAAGDKAAGEAGADAPAPREALSEEEQRYREVVSFLGPDVRTPVGIPRDYKPHDHSIHPLFRIDLGDYGGPLDLMVYLIRKHEIDVFDIPIRFLTERYLEMLEVLRALDIDVAAEFLVLAADLTHIKSKMLLPAKEGEPVEDEIEDEGDPRADLVRRLLEYQKYRDAAEALGGRDQLGRDVFARQPPLAEDDDELDPGLKQVSIFKLVELMAGMIKKKPVRHEISYESFNIAERMHFVMRFGQSRGGRFMLIDLMEQVVSRAELVVTFIAVLESTKLQLVRLRMDEPMTPRPSLWAEASDGAPAPAATESDDPPTSSRADDPETSEVASAASDDDPSPPADDAKTVETAGAERADELPAEGASVRSPTDAETVERVSALADDDAETVELPTAPAGDSISASTAETRALLNEVNAIEREMADQMAEEEALEARRATATERVRRPWKDDEPLPLIWVELTGKSFEGDIMDDYG